MKLTWIGHSCFKIESNGYSIVIDPYEDGSVPGLLPVREQANMVLCSHEHGDHNARQCVKLLGGSENPFKITKIETYHDNKNGALRGSNIIYIIEDKHTRIAHMGDLGCMLTEDQVKVLLNIDAVMIPVGGYFTIDAGQAAAITEMIRPGMIIPMHYRSNEKSSHTFGYHVLGTVDDFVKAFDSRELLETSTVDTDAIRAKVVVLRPQNV